MRFEGVGAVTMGQLADLLGTGCTVRVQPVIDLNAVPSSDAYEAPERLKDALLLRSPADVIPFGTCTSRRMDFDHTINYRPPEQGGPPGQTSTANTARLCRYHHRVKTHGAWTYRRTGATTVEWTSPQGRTYTVEVACAAGRPLTGTSYAVYDAAPGTWGHGEPLYSRPFPCDGQVQRTVNLGLPAGAVQIDVRGLPSDAVAAYGVIRPE